MKNAPPLASGLEAWHRAAQQVGFADLIGGARSLGIIVPHADDETLGCGGLIAEAASRGVAVTVTILTDGAASHPNSKLWPAPRLRAIRRAEAVEAVARLTGGRGTIVFGTAPDGELAAHRNVAHILPPADILVSCWLGDHHPDHRAAYAIAAQAAAASGTRLLAFPLWTLVTASTPPTDRPVFKLDISASYSRKRHALAAYPSQRGQLITDDPQGFALDADLESLFVRLDELFVEIDTGFAARSGHIPG